MEWSSRLLACKKTGEDSQPGINGGLTPKMNQQSSGTSGSSRVTNTIDVPSIDDFSKKISTEGGKVVTPNIQALDI